MAEGEEAGHVPSVTPGFSSVQHRGDATGVVANEAAGDQSQPAPLPIKDESRDAARHCTLCPASLGAVFEARPVCSRYPSSAKRFQQPDLRACCRSRDSCGLQSRLCCRVTALYQITHVAVQDHSQIDIPPNSKCLASLQLPCQVMRMRMLAPG